MKNKILTSILAGTFLLSGCSRFIKQESVVIPKGYNAVFVQTLKSLRNEEDYVIGKAYAVADNLEEKSGKSYDVWGKEIARSFSSEEYQTSCLENARQKACEEIIYKINPDVKADRSKFVMIDILTSMDEEGKKCYYEGAIGRDSLKLLHRGSKKK